MIETTIVWHNAREERPAKSGQCLLLCDRYKSTPYVCTTNYSKVHDRFNCADNDGEPIYAFEPDYWAEITPLEVFRNEEDV